MAVDIQKLLPQRPVGNKTIIILSDTSVVNKEEKNREKYTEVKKKLGDIKGLLEGTLAAEKKQLDDEKKEQQKEKRGKQESQLEVGKKKKDKKDLTAKIPGMSFLDRIKKFINDVIFGFLLVKLVDFAPLLVPIATGLAALVKFLVDFGGKILNGLISFVDFGYKAYDWTRGAIKNIGGEEAAENFDKLSSTLNTFLNAAFILAMASAGAKGPKIGGGVKPKPGQGLRPKVTTTGGRGLNRPDIRNPLRDRPKVTTTGGATPGKPNIRNPLRPRPPITGGSTRSIGSKALKTLLRPLKPYFRQIPIIGGIIDFAINYFILKEPLGKAAFLSVGSTLVGALGAAIGSFPPLIPFGGPFIGAALGGVVGDSIARILYDMIFEKKEPEEPKVEGRAEGGLSTRTIGGSENVDKSEDDRSIGGVDIEKKPDKVKLTEDDDFDKTKKTIADVGKEYNKVDYFGPILAVSSKMMLGEKITPMDYESVGQGFTNLYLSGEKEGKIDGSTGIKKWVTSSMEKEISKNKNITKKIKENDSVDTEDEETPTTAEGKPLPLITLMQ